MRHAGESILAPDGSGPWRFRVFKTAQTPTAELKDDVAMKCRSVSPRAARQQT